MIEFLFVLFCWFWFLCIYNLLMYCFFFFFFLLFLFFSFFLLLLIVLLPLLKKYISKNHTLLIVGTCCLFCGRIVLALAYRWELLIFGELFVVFGAAVSFTLLRWLSSKCFQIILNNPKRCIANLFYFFLCIVFLAALHLLVVCLFLEVLR